MENLSDPEAQRLVEKTPRSRPVKVACSAEMTRRVEVSIVPVGRRSVDGTRPATPSGRHGNHNQAKAPSPCDATRSFRSQVVACLATLAVLAVLAVVGSGGATTVYKALAELPTVGSGLLEYCDPSSVFC